MAMTTYRRHLRRRLLHHGRRLQPVFALRYPHYHPAAQILETYWYNGQQVPDPTGNPTGYGFYAPMYDTPANVVNGSSLPNSSGISPINLFPWLEKLFVGNTVGGPATINNTFATHFPSLWDYRPGDDAYDTTLPYLNPISGNIVTSDPRLCLAPVTASAFATTQHRERQPDPHQPEPAG